MKYKLFFSFILIFAWLAKCLSQVPDSVRHVMEMPVFQQDTVPVENNTALTDTTKTPSTLLVATDSVIPKKRGLLRRIFKDDYPNPKKALYLSLAFPAGGQLYNKRWWKPPIIWAGYVALIISAQKNTYYYKDFRNAYKAELKHQTHKYSGLGYDAGDLKRIRDGYDKNKQLSYIGMFGLHVLQVAEAFVDCHLKTFDVSDDISFRLKPSIAPSFASQYPAMSMGLAFSFGK